MSQVSKKLTFTILSISLLTVMAGAAIAPALGVISEHFAGTPDILIQLIVSIPALLIIITDLFFRSICRFLRTKTIALGGLILYIVTGAGAFFCNDIWSILILRALLGVSVGLIMPLSTGLLAYYFKPEEMGRLMGLSAAMNQMGGVIATLLAGLLANVQWNYGFLVYAIAVFAIVLVVLYLPNEKLVSDAEQHSEQPFSVKTLVRFHPSVIGMLLLMIIFFIFPTNFALVARHNTALSNNAITCIMVGLDLVAFFVGLVFGGLMIKFRTQIKYFAPAGFLLGYIVYAASPYTWGLLTGSLLIGMANGVGVPYLNTIASIKGGKDSATTVMPLLSISLYAGQFLSPLLVLPLGRLLFGSADIVAPFKVGVIFCMLFLIQVYLTRDFQSLPPQRRD